MDRPFMFAALCQRAHPLKHSLAESEKQRQKSSLAEKFVSRVTRQPRYHCIFRKYVEKIQFSLKSDFIRRPIYIFFITSRSILRTIRNVSDKICKENQNTNFVFNIFFRKSTKILCSIFFLRKSKHKFCVQYFFFKKIVSFEIM